MQLLKIKSESTVKVKWCKNAHLSFEESWMYHQIVKYRDPALHALHL